MSREDALRIYSESVNQPDTLFSFNETLPAKLDQMLALLHDPITPDEAYALNDVLYRRRRYCDMIAWLQDDPVSWNGYFAREEFRAEEADRQLLEDVRRGEEDWANGVTPKNEFGWDFSLSPELVAELDAKAKAAHLPFANPCPKCGTPAESLDWYRYSDQSPFGFSCSGWKTRCRFCLQIVSEFVEIMGTSRRRLKRPAALLLKNDMPM